MPQAVLITADRAVLEDGARGATAVLAIDGAIVLVAEEAA